MWSPGQAREPPASKVMYAVNVNAKNLGAALKLYDLFIVYSPSSNVTYYDVFEKPLLPHVTRHIKVLRQTLIARIHSINLVNQTIKHQLLLI